MLTLPNKMAVWFCVKADICGTPSILLRGVNFRPKDPSIEKVNGPWLHVPSISYEFNNEKHAALDSVEHAAGSKVVLEWPGILRASLRNPNPSLFAVGSDQDFTGFWSGTKGQALVMPVTRFGIDLGKLDKEPQVSYRPGAELSFARDPVFWVPVDHITQTHDCVPVDQGVRRTPYTLSGTHWVIMETNNKGGQAIATIQDMAFQETVAEGFKIFFGNDLFPTRAYHKPATTLTLRTDHGC